MCIRDRSANRDPKALITTMLDVSPVEVAATDELPYPNMAAVSYTHLDVYKRQTEGNS